MKKTFDQLERGDLLRDEEQAEWCVAHIDGVGTIELIASGDEGAMSQGRTWLHRSAFGQTTYDVERPRQTFTISIPGDWDAEDWYQEHLEAIDDGQEFGVIVDVP